VLRRHKQPILPYADSIVYGFSFGWFFGRMGCTLNHEHPGTATNFFLGRFCRPVEGHTIEWPQWMGVQVSDLRFSHCVDQGPAVTSYAQQVSMDYPGVLAVHDMGFYEAIYAALLFTTYLVLERKKRFDGLYALILVYTYAPLRFAMDFLRPEVDNVRYSGLTPAQWGCIGFLVVVTAVLAYYRKNLQGPGAVKTA
jgi:phosphatidylglycerol:prolipoprotein diacylglycerol transferase